MIIIIMALSVVNLEFNKCAHTELTFIIAQRTVSAILSKRGYYLILKCKAANGGNREGGYLYSRTSTDS